MLPPLKTLLVPRTAFEKIAFISVIALTATSLLSLTGFVTFGLAPLAYNALLARMVIPRRQKKEQQLKTIISVKENIQEIFGWIVPHFRFIVRDNPSRTWEDIKWQWGYAVNALKKPFSKVLYGMMLISAWVTIGLLAFNPAPGVILLGSILTSLLIINLLRVTIINLFPQYVSVPSQYSLAPQNIEKFKDFYKQKTNSFFLDIVLLTLAIYAGITTLGISTATLLWAPWNVLPTLWSLFSVTANPLLNGVIAAAAIATMMLAVNVAWSMVVKGFCAVRGINIYEWKPENNKPLIKAISLKLTSGSRQGLVNFTTDNTSPVIGVGLERQQQQTFYQLEGEWVRYKNSVQLEATLFFNPQVETNRWVGTTTGAVVTNKQNSLDVDLADSNSMVAALEKAMMAHGIDHDQVSLAITQCKEQWQRLAQSLKNRFSQHLGYRPAENMNNAAAPPEQEPVEGAPENIQAPSLRANVSPRKSHSVIAS